MRWEKFDQEKEDVLSDAKLRALGWHRKFAFLPVTIGNKEVWMEFYETKFEYSYRSPSSGYTPCYKNRFCQRRPDDVSTLKQGKI